ncbi:MAG: T9SS type A sorting domain-containing protein [Crocinitomicaceae bacterium]|nr:T9SS type A sorting domain-containing protein [Crocinitomicaceae bacterium]
MKKNYILGIVLLSSVGFFAMQRTGEGTVEKYLASNGHTVFADGAPTGKTGAPGESTCIDCHSSGTIQDGSAVNNLLVLEGATSVTNYIPGHTYNVSLQLNLGDIMEGFQATVLDVATNSMAGAFPGTGGLGTAITSAAGREYANHTMTSNLEGNFAWIWEWAAPTTDIGPVKFYVASNVANGNGATSGDVIYLSEHLFGSDPGIGLDELAVFTDFSAGYASNSNQVIVKFNSREIGAMNFNLVDMNGRSVYTSNLGDAKIGSNEANVTLPSEVENGIYVVNFFIGNHAMSSKIMIQK